MRLVLLMNSDGELLIEEHLLEFLMKPHLKERDGLKIEDLLQTSITMLEPLQLLLSLYLMIKCITKSFRAITISGLRATDLIPDLIFKK